MLEDLQAATRVLVTQVLLLVRLLNIVTSIVKAACKFKDIRRKSIGEIK